MSVIGLAADRTGPWGGQDPAAGRAAAFFHDFQGWVIGQLGANFLPDLRGGHFQQGHSLGKMSGDLGSKLVVLDLEHTGLPKKYSVLVQLLQDVCHTRCNICTRQGREGVDGKEKGWSGRIESASRDKKGKKIAHRHLRFQIKLLADLPYQPYFSHPVRISGLQRYLRRFGLRRIQRPAGLPGCDLPRKDWGKISRHSWTPANDFFHNGRTDSCRLAGKSS